VNGRVRNVLGGRTWKELRPILCAAKTPRSGSAERDKKPMMAGGSDDHREALRVAIARRAGCEAILANDTDFRRVDHPRAIILDDFVGDDET